MHQHRVLSHIRELGKKAGAEARGLDPWIEVDGGQNGANAWQTVAAGAEALVAGSAVFGSDDYAGAIARLRSNARPAAGASAPPPHRP